MYLFGTFHATKFSKFILILIFDIESWHILCLDVSQDEDRQTMKTRIREMRRQRGMTLQQLAESIRPEPTTPQTIGRLETGVRTVSLDWLARIAEALDCHISDLLEMPEHVDMPLIGTVGAQGMVSPSESSSIEIAPSAIRPVAVRISQRYGSFETGDLLICDRYDDADMGNAIGRDAVVKTAEGHLLLRHVIRGARADSYTLVPLTPGDSILYDTRLQWAAVVKNLFRSLR